MLLKLMKLIQLLVCKKTHIYTVNLRRKLELKCKKERRPHVSYLWPIWFVADIVVTRWTAIGGLGLSDLELDPLPDR